MLTGLLEHAILETLAYSDIFEYPLRLGEIHRYLTMQANREQVAQSLSLLQDQVGEREGFYFLAGREKIVEVRKQRTAYSKKLLPYAIRYGQLLGHLPFIRMAALTGSLAVMNGSKKADFDYMLVTARGRVWTARAFALLFNRFTRVFGHTLCPNLILSDASLAWRSKDLYSARELYQMIPITGFDVYQRLMNANAWVRDIFPNITPFSGNSMTQAGSLQSVLELPLRDGLGDRIERWEMERKIERLSKQAGFDEEVIFNAEMCQGNFDHHRQRTNKMLAGRLSRFNREVTDTLATTLTEIRP
ncbi:MAG TPA: hypothetical protein VK851_13435 [Anaerolineales bacterium]|nr:hypothetical protein [Anaerolineales bacterium]